MDCGPAALASLLGAHGLDGNVDVLRDICATGADGTSVDDLEDVAVGLGLAAEQMLVPLADVLAVPERYLPAIVVTLAPDGAPHFVVAWRIRRGRVDVVDPAVGRRRIRLEAFVEEVLHHEMVVPEAMWAQFAASEDARAALVARLRSSGVAAQTARTRLQEAAAEGPVEGVGRLLQQLDPHGRQLVQREGFGEDGEPQVRVSGAIVLRALTRGQDDASPEPAFARALAPAQGGPFEELAALFAGERRSVVTALMLAGIGGVAATGEVLAARPMLDRGATAEGLLLLGLAVAVALAALVAAGLLAARVGRGVERELRDRLLGRVARLGDGYVRSRPTGDLAERAHAIVLIRRAVELAGLAVQRTAEALAGAVAIVALAPGAWPAAVLLVALAVVAPRVLVRWCAEPDLRARGAQGAIGLQLTDTLAAGRVLWPLRAGPTLRAVRAPLLGVWSAAVAVVQQRLAVAVLAIQFTGLAAAVLAVALAAGTDASTGTIIAVAALAFTSTLAVQDVAYVARRILPTRNALARVLEPLRAELTDPRPAEDDQPPGPGAVLTLDAVTVRLGSQPVLTDLTVTLTAGEHVAVVGPSGAGKSSLVAVLAGWLRPTEGTVTVDGAPLDGEALARLRRSTAWADATTRIVDDTLAVNADWGVDHDAPLAAARLGCVGIDPNRAECPADELTGADRQRLLLARALGRPHARLVLLDEALADLDSEERRMLLSRAREQWATATLLHVTHDAAGALAFPRVLVIEDGQIVEDGDPVILVEAPASRLRGLIDAQTRLAERIQVATAARAPQRMAIEPDPRSAGREWRAILASRAIVTLVAIALILGVIGTIALALVGERLDSGARSGAATGPGWIAASIGAMATIAALSAAATWALGRASVTLGTRLRLRALDAAGRPAAHVRSVGRRVGAVLELEQLESVALGAGAVLGLALAEATVAVGLLVLAGVPSAAAAIGAGLAASALLARMLLRAGRDATRMRARVTEHLIERMLALRTVTIQEDPASERARRHLLLEALQASHQRLDVLRVAIAAALPRATVLTALTVLALDPPDGPAATAGALGALLIAFAALEAITAAIGDLVPATAPALAAAELLRPPADPRETADPHQEVHVPAPAEILHQTVGVNAMLASRSWPPGENAITRFEQRLAALGLDALVDRMPLGPGQQLGETGWRLSQGERARLALLRALMAEPSSLHTHRLLSALDPHTAHRVLSALEHERCTVSHE